MKNKIFELYKPESLKDFLEFYKANPEEKFVYVAQQPPANINMSRWLLCDIDKFFFRIIFIKR